MSSDKPWSDLTQKANPVGADKLAILDSEDADPDTTNKTITIESLPTGSDTLSGLTIDVAKDWLDFDILNTGDLGINTSTPGIILSADFTSITKTVQIENTAVSTDTADLTAIAADEATLNLVSTNEPPGDKWFRMSTHDSKTFLSPVSDSAGSLGDFAILHHETLRFEVAGPMDIDDYITMTQLAQSTGSTLIEVALTSGGTGYIEGEDVTLTGQISSAANADARVHVTNGIIDRVHIVDGGSGYMDTEGLTIFGQISSQSDAVGTAVTNIVLNDTGQLFVLDNGSGTSTLIFKDDANVEHDLVAGNIVGPTPSTDKAIATWVGTDGDELQDNPNVTISSSGLLHIDNGNDLDLGNSANSENFDNGDLVNIRHLLLKEDQTTTPFIEFFNTEDTVPNNNPFGRLRFFGLDDSSTKREFGRIGVEMADVQTASFAAQYKIQLATDGAEFVDWFDLNVGNSGIIQNYFPTLAEHTVAIAESKSDMQKVNIIEFKTLKMFNVNSLDSAAGLVAQGQGNAIMNLIDLTALDNQKWFSLATSQGVTEITTLDDTSTTGGILLIKVCSGGTGYTNGETATVVGTESSSNTATVTLTTSGGVITAITPSAPGFGGSGYLFDEFVTITGDTSTVNNAVVYISQNAGVIDGYFFSPGTGYTNDEEAIVTGQNSASNDARATLSVTGGAITAATILDVGTNYNQNEPVTLTGQTSNQTDANAKVTLTFAGTQFISFIHSTGIAEYHAPLEIQGVNITFERSGGGVDTLSGFPSGTAYIDQELVDIINATGSGFLGRATVAGGVIQSVVVIDAGTGYTDTESVNLNGQLSSQTDAVATTNVSSDGKGFIDMQETTEPANPASDFGRLYVFDNSGTTGLFFRDSVGTTTDLLAAGVTTLGGLTDVNLAGQGVGSVLYNDDGTNWLQLSAGADGQVLTLVSGKPAWSGAGGGATVLNDLTDVTITPPTVNDLLVSDVEGDWINRQGIFVGILGLGTQAQDLTMGNNKVILGTAALEFTATTQNIVSNGSDLQYNINSGSHDWKISTTTKMALDNSALSLTSIDLTGANTVEITQASTPLLEFFKTATIGNGSVTNSIDFFGTDVGGSTKVQEASIDVTSEENAVGLTEGGLFFNIFRSGGAVPMMSFNDAKSDEIILLKKANFTVTATDPGLNVGSKTDPDPTGGINGDIYYNTTNSKFRAFENDNWVDMIGAAGGQTPWLSDIDADGFDLTDLSNLEFRVPTEGVPAVGTTSIYATTNGMTFIIPTGDEFSYTIQGVSQYTFSETALDVQGNNITNIGILQFNDINTKLDQVGTDLNFSVVTGGNFFFKDGIITEYSMSSSTFDVNGNTITNISQLVTETVFPAQTGMVRMANSERVGWRNAANLDDIFIEANSSDDIVFSIDSIIEYTFSSTQTDFGGNNLVNVGYQDIDRITDPSNPAVDHGRFYVKQIDVNNDGLFIRIKQNGSFQEVQIV